MTNGDTAPPTSLAAVAPATPSAPAVPGGAWAQVRGALLALHLGGMTLLGLPEPAVEAKDQDDPDVIAWFDRTHASLASWGIEVDRDDLIAWGTWAGQGWLAARDVVLAPVIVYARYTGCHQHWAMFGSVPEESAWLFIEGRAGGRWELVAQSRYSDRTFRKDFFDQERTRSLLNLFIKKKSKDAYDRFGAWLLPQLREAHPEYDAFRMGIQKVALPPPDELARTGQLTLGKRFWVQELRPESADAPAPDQPEDGP
jgi:hypothetical protein